MENGVFAKNYLQGAELDLPDKSAPFYRIKWFTRCFNFICDKWRGNAVNERQIKRIAQFVTEARIGGGLTYLVDEYAALDVPKDKERLIIEPLAKAAKRYQYLFKQHEGVLSGQDYGQRVTELINDYTTQINDIENIIDNPPDNLPGTEIVRLAHRREELEQLSAEASALVANWYERLNELAVSVISLVEGTPGHENAPESDPLEWIEPHLKEVLRGYEVNLQGDIQKWMNKEDIEYCAAFINMLYESKFFVPNKLGTAKCFALARYFVNIKSSLDNLRKSTNSKKLSEKMYAIKRKATGKVYGAM